MMKQKFTTTLEDKVIERLKIQAIREKTSVSALIEKLAIAYLDKVESAPTPRAD